MEKDLQLIKLYCVICHQYRIKLINEVQRCSNNFCPQFSDEECITIVLWGIANQKFTLKSTYKFIKDYYADWFMHLPKYKAFNKRVCYLAEAFKSLSDTLLSDIEDESGCITHLIDSMPIVVAKQKRSDKAKAASGICDKGYCDSKKMYYYGVKLHTIGQQQYKTIPTPRQMLLTKASTHDLTAAKEMLDDVYGIELFADKAYKDTDWQEYIRTNNYIEILTPVKLKKGQCRLDSADKLFSNAVSKARQPIESFFNWLQEKTSIESASKVRSSNGLISFVFSRIAVACLIILNIIIP